MNMHSPPHPGEVLRELFFTPLNKSVTEVASALGISRQSFSNLVHEKTGISAEMAYRLSKAFGNTPEFWMNLQKQYDLWAVRKFAARMKIKPLTAA
jgi:antitoxin HigA-1